MARLKNIPGAHEIVMESSFVVWEAEAYRGRWNEVFGNDHPIELEIGIGKGRFLMDLAERYPEKNFLGMEMYSTVLFRAVQKAEQRVSGAAKTLPVSETERPACPEDCNFRLLRFDATNLTSLFAQGEISRIYLNFSDPWPKDRHADRRLTSARFLERYEKILVPGGELIFKTDNRGLFDFSLEEVRARGWEVQDLSYDLHRDGVTREANDPKKIMTEYEEKFSRAGNPICMLEARVP